MLTVTDAAVEGLSTMLDGTDAEEGQGLRLVHQGEGQLSLAIDSERDGDQVVHQDERPVLFVDEELSSALDGATLDATETSEGTRLTILRPGEAEPESE